MERYFGTFIKPEVKPGQYKNWQRLALEEGLTVGML